MSGPQFELLVSSSESVDKDGVAKLGRLCYKCEERYPILFKGLFKEVKMNIVDTLLSFNPNTPSATVTNFRRIIEGFIAKPIIKKFGFNPRDGKLFECINEFKRDPQLKEITDDLTAIRCLGNAGAHAVNECIYALCSIMEFFLGLDFGDAVRFIYIKTSNPDAHDPESNGGVFEPYFACDMN